MKLKHYYASIGFSQDIRNLLMDSYTVILALGYTLKCMPIKIDTMGKYLNAVEEVCIPYKTISPVLKFMRLRYHFIDEIIKESKRWKEILDEKEPLINDMILHIIYKAKDEDNDNGIYSNQWPIG